MDSDTSPRRSALAGSIAQPEASRPLRAHALVSCALSCLDVVATEWTRTAGTASLGALLDTAIRSVRD
jgi:hypothetical protein